MFKEKYTAACHWLITQLRASFFSRFMKADDVLPLVRRLLPLVLFCAGLLFFVFSAKLLERTQGMNTAVAQLSEKLTARQAQLTLYQHLQKKKIKTRSVDTAAASLQVVLSGFSSYPDLSLHAETRADERTLHVSAIPFNELMRLLNDIQRVSAWVVVSAQLNEGHHRGEVSADIKLHLLGMPE